LVTLEVSPELRDVNEELTLTFTVTHDGEPVNGLYPEARYIHLGVGDGAEAGHDADTGTHDQDGGVEDHIEMMPGTTPGTYAGTHTFEEEGNYEIEFSFEGHDGPELHSFDLVIGETGHTH